MLVDCGSLWKTDGVGEGVLIGFGRGDLQKRSSGK